MVKLTNFVTNNSPFTQMLAFNGIIKAVNFMVCIYLFVLLVSTNPKFYL